MIISFFLLLLLLLKNVGHGIKVLFVWLSVHLDYEWIKYHFVLIEIFLYIFWLLQKLSKSIHVYLMDTSCVVTLKCLRLCANEMYKLEKFYCNLPMLKLWIYYFCLIISVVTWREIHSCVGLIHPYIQTLMCILNIFR